MKPPSSPRAPASPRISSLFLLPGILLLVAVIYLLALPDNFKLIPDTFRSSSPSCHDNGSASAAGAGHLAADTATKEAVDLRLLMGILTTPSTYERRALLRLAYSLQPRPVRAVVDVRFVMCRIDREEDRILVALEIIAHGDVIVLNCTENMNDGKTYEYFSAVPRLFAGDGERYDYVGKIDDDVYYRVAALAESLRGKARRDAYHGSLTPCHAPPATQYMSGMGYVVSWDVVEWLAATPELRDDHHDWEDQDFGGWLRKGGRGKNVYNEEPRMYDYWDRDMNADVNCYRHDHIADAVAVHKLKDRLKWARTLHFFNATQGLKSSKLYHVDLQNVYHV